MVGHRSRTEALTCGGLRSCSPWPAPSRGWWGRVEGRVYEGGPRRGPGWLDVLGRPSELPEPRRHAPMRTAWPPRRRDLVRPAVPVLRRECAVVGARHSPHVPSPARSPLTAARHDLPEALRLAYQVFSGGC